MELLVPLKVTPDSVSDIKAKRSVTIERVVPGPFRGKNQLGLAIIAEITFNSKFDAVKIHSRNNYFMKPNELSQITSFLEAVTTTLGKPRKKKKKGE